MPPSLMACTASAAKSFAFGRNPAGLISLQVSSLTSGAVTMVVMKTMLAVAMAVAISHAGWGVCYFAPASEPPEAEQKNPGGPPSRPPATGREADQVRSEVKKVLERAVLSVPAVGDVEQRVWILCEVGPSF